MEDRRARLEEIEKIHKKIVDTLRQNSKLDEDDIAIIMKYITESFQFGMSLFFIPYELWEKYKKIYSNDKHKLFEVCEEINRIIKSLPDLERLRKLEYYNWQHNGCNE